jgi:uncharacterized repeat protein (TIGR01451 family)
MLQDTDPSHYVGVANPSLTIDKTYEGYTDNDNDGAISVGDTLNYQIVATNEGNVPLTNVTVTDPLLGTLDCTPTTPATLAPAATVTCTGTHIVTQADIDAPGPGGANGKVENTATADSDETEPVEDTVTVPIPQVHRIDIQKSTNGKDADAAPGPLIPVGNSVDWTYVVTNTGNVTEVVPEFVVFEVAVLRPEPAVWQARVVRQDKRRTADDRQAHFDG